MTETAPETKSGDFIRDIVAADVREGRCPGVVTRFPPEPNGYLHIGHAKAICLDFGVAAEFGGRCHLRMDDTNPAKESMEFVESIRRDVRWLGFDWGEHFHFSADYFERMYEVCRELIRKGKAYVCELSAEEFKECRGVPTSPGKPSPYRDRPAEESLDLFRRMREGEFADGAVCVRAKIDMASPNIHLRDPVLYRVMRSDHYRAGSRWVIYPTYDFAHPLEDAFEGVTHSLCTLEFEVHRPLYDWVIDQLGMERRPRQIEFARLNLTYTVMSKRKLLELVKGGFVSGWDDPRMPTVCGMRRRGYTASAIRAFVAKIGVTKYESLTDVALLEHCVREELNRTAGRVMAVLDPVKLVIDNYPVDREEEMEAVNNPEDAAAGTRKTPFCRELWIEREDYLEEAPKKFYRLTPGAEVRLRYGYIVKCTGAERGPDGAVREVHCTYDPATRGGNTPDGRKVRGTIHWVSARHGVECPVRLYDRLFAVEEPENVPEGTDYKANLNAASLQTVMAVAEPEVRRAVAGETQYQFERKGYFFADPEESGAGRPVFNQIVPLRDSWARDAGR